VGKLKVGTTECGNIRSFFSRVKIKFTVQDGAQRVGARVYCQNILPNQYYRKRNLFLYDDTVKMGRVTVS